MTETVLYPHLTDVTVACPVDEILWRTYPRALPEPYAVPSGNLTARHRMLTVASADGLYETVSWVCGTHTMTVHVATWVTVPCLAGGLPWRWSPAMPVPDRPPVDCTKHAHKMKAPGDLYVNPRYGGSCDCCGQQGTHTVRRDGEGALPTCVQAYGLDVAMGWTP